MILFIREVEAEMKRINQPTIKISFTEDENEFAFVVKRSK